MLDTARPPNQAVQTITGTRRLSLTMLVARDRADGFTGLAAGTAKPMRLLGAFQEAEPYLGLPAHAFKLVCWLVKQTQGHDWETGSRPIAWPSARMQAEYLGLSPARVKMLNRALFEAGIFVIRDNEQGKRYGRRGKDGRIIEAYGFDLSPLAVRHGEFIRIAAEAKLERGHMKALRKRVTIARRAIGQAGAILAEAGLLPAGWAKLEAEAAELVIAGRQAGYSDELALVAAGLERRQSEAEQWVRDAVCKATKPVETHPEGLENEPRTTTTNLTSQSEDTVIAHRGSSSAAQPVPPALPSAPAGPSDKVLRLNPSQLLDLAPRLAQHVLAANPNWRVIVDAAGAGLRHELDVSPSLWGEACRLLGREQAAIALAIVSTKGGAHFSGSPGGYFAGMVRKAERGELHLERTLWALREAKWGKPNPRQIN